MRVVSVINQKGGVGKTTTTCNLGAALAAHGRRVCLIDLDPQANLGTHLGIEDGSGHKTVYDVLVRGTPLDEAMSHLRDEGLWLVPSTLDLSAAEIELVAQMGRETRLLEALEALPEDQRFDDVLLDCPPSLGLLTINALAASNEVLIPLQAEFFALQGMAKLMEVIELVRTRINPKLKLRGVVACKVDRRPRLTNEVLAEVKRHFGEMLFETIIRPNVKLAEAPSHGRSVLSYAPDSNGARDYGRLAAELLGLPLREDGEEIEYVFEEEEAEGSPEAASSPAAEPEGPSAPSSEARGEGGPFGAPAPTDEAETVANPPAPSLGEESAPDAARPDEPAAGDPEPTPPAGPDSDPVPPAEDPLTASPPPPSHQVSEEETRPDEPEREEGGAAPWRSPWSPPPESPGAF